MSLRPRWHRRAFGLWVGILTALAAVTAVAYIRFPDAWAPIAIVAGVVALVVGTILTLRLRAQDAEPLITVRDLRQDR